MAGGLGSCTNDSLAFAGSSITNYWTTRATFFTIRNSAQQVDLVAATTGQNCTEDEAFAIDVDATLEVPDHVTWEDYEGKTCAPMASATPAPTPCQVKIDSAAA
ncbi:hypothetical protein G6011_07380 [Alternaria panax]|uniref:DUF7136 domain-containing protein n=1 Tax=Alternaria panax TaxID=48097 RepID=A0AAD4FFZ4_9PLEO|nr:hypothetical protein G6011_07380 [Alternaria panax]